MPYVPALIGIGGPYFSFQAPKPKAAAGTSMITAAAASTGDQRCRPVMGCRPARQAGSKRALTAPAHKLSTVRAVGWC